MSKVYYNHTTKLYPVKAGLAPAATIAMKREGDFFVWGIAICSKNDNFNKTYGRETAELRMNQGFRVTPVPKALKESLANVGISEEMQNLAFLYQLAATITAKPRAWRRKLSKFNEDLKKAQMAEQDAQMLREEILGEPNTVVSQTKPYSISTREKAE